MMLENGSTSSRMQTVVEDALPPTPPALPPVATTTTGPSIPSETPEVPLLHLNLPPPPSRISQETLPVASRSPFSTPDGRWELGADIQVVMVKCVSTVVTKLTDTATYTKFKVWLSAV